MHLKVFIVIFYNWTYGKASYRKIPLNIKYLLISEIKHHIGICDEAIESNDKTKEYFDQDHTGLSVIYFLYFAYVLFALRRLFLFHEQPQPHRHIGKSLQG